MSATGDPVAVRLRLIGQMEAWTLNSESILPPGRKTRALLAIVALSAPRPVMRARLAELLWSRRPEEQARASLRQEIHRLLDVLAPAGQELLSINRDSLALRPGVVWVDVDEVLRATAAHSASLALLDGDLLESMDGIDPAFDVWLAAERERLRDRVGEAGDLPAAIDEEVICVSLTHVHYKSARRWPMARVTDQAHAKGALALWDLSHSAGALAVDLNGAGADLAVGCGYKYLNGGPGAPAFAFVAERHQAQIRSPLTGWMGHADPFAFVDDFAPAAGIRRQLCGTPPILSLAALEVGVDLMLRADMAALERKGGVLGDLFITLVEQRCAGLGLALGSPRAAADRGSHVVFAHPDAYAVMRALIERGVIGDVRAPDLLRFGFTPLYTRHADLFPAVEALFDVLATGVYRDARFGQRLSVT